MLLERYAAIALLAALIFFASPEIGGSQVSVINIAPNTSIAPGGGAEGGDWVNIPLGDIGGVRNIDCGKVTGNPADLNCDVAGGDATHRGNVILNWDLGKCVAVFNGDKLPDAILCANKRPWFRRKPRIGGTPPNLGATH